jgi:hypothetical protein
MFPDTTIKTNPDSSLKIAFEASVISYGIDSLLKIPDTTITTVTTNTLSPSIPVVLGPGQQIFSSLSSTYYDFPNGILLTKAIVKFGKVRVEL